MPLQEYATVGPWSIFWIRRVELTALLEYFDDYYSGWSELENNRLHFTEHFVIKASHKCWGFTAHIFCNCIVL